MTKYPQDSILRPKTILLRWLVLVALCGVAIAIYPQIDINPTFKSMIMPNDPDRQADTDAKKIFGDDEALIIAVHNEAGVFNTATLQKIDRITKQVKALEGVRDIYSITDIDNIRGKEGTLITTDLMTKVPTSAAGLAALERDTFDNHTYPNFVIAPDKKVASINVEMDLAQSDTKFRGALTEKILEIVNAEKGGPEKLYVTGFPVSSYFGGVYMITDMAMFGAVSMLLLIALMWIVYRNWVGIVFSLSTAFVGVAGAYGLMSLMGERVTMPLSAVMVFVMVFGMEYSIYVGYAYIEQVLHERKKGRVIRDHKFVLSESIRGVRKAVVLSMITTAIGFLSMLTNPVPDLSKMGFFLAVGTIFVGIGALTIVPAIISLFPFEVREREAHNKWLGTLLEKLGASVAKSAKVHFLVITAITTIGILGFMRLSTDTDAMQYFRKESTIRQDEEFVRERMAGTAYLQAVVKAPDLDTFKQPENLRKLEELAKLAETMPNVTKALSHADHLKLMNRALHDGDPAYHKVPDTKEAVEQYLLLHKEPDDFRTVIDPDYKSASIALRLNTMSSAKLKIVENKLEEAMRAAFPGFEVNVVGTTLLVHRAFDMMADSMVLGFSLTFIVIWVLMCLIFRSLLLGTLLMVPNTIPVVLLYSLLGWTGYPLDPPTAVTGAIALGIAMDDTIHFFRTWLDKTRFAKMDSREAVRETLREVGRPMVLSSIVYGLGFGVMLMSRYGTLSMMGIMLCFSALCAIVCDLLLTPALLTVAKVTARKPSEEEVKSVRDLDKSKTDPKRTKLSEYSDQEIERLSAYDFFALCGKTVIRHGGKYGTRRLVYEMNLKPGMKLLEIGTGVGASSFALAAEHGVEVTAVDLSPYMIEVATQRAKELGVADKIKFVLSPGGALPFEDGTFDAVLTESVVMYADADAIFSEARRVLKPGGILGLHDWSWTTPPPNGLQGMVNNFACYSNANECKFFDAPGWEASLQRNGFEISFAEDFPFAYFTWHGMVDDEGTWPVIKMFSRIMARPAALKKMAGIMLFLDKYQAWFTYALMVARKPEAPEVSDSPAPKAATGKRLMVL